MLSLFFLFISMPILELYFLFKVGREIGGANTFLVVILTGIVGAYFARSQGKQILQKIQNQMQSGEMPGDQMIHGFLVLVGGILLMTPGFITDALGLMLVFPLTRAIMIKPFKEKMAVRMKGPGVQFYSATWSSGPKNSQYQSQNPYRVVEEKASNAVIDVEAIKED